MVKSTKNNKLKKRKVSKNRKRKHSSNQKENKPKNGKNNKVTTADPTDAIAKSKQLAMKKNSNQTTRQTSRNTNRVCGNGRPLPSLAELEKYFEDSDGEENTPKTKRPEPCKTPTSTEQTEEVKVEGKLLSPKTISKISERMLHMFSDISDPTELLNITPPPVVPPKKRKKTEIPYIVGCNERPKITSKPNTNFCKGDEEYGVEPSNEVDDSPPPKRAKKSNIHLYSKSIFNAKSDEIAKRLTNADTNYESSDSDKTVEYMPSTVQSQRPPSFSPLPSTSQDRETFIKNDELFNQSLREKKVVTKEPTPKEEKKDIFVLDKPETFGIDDLVGEPRTHQPSVSKNSNSEMDIIEPVQTNSLVNAPIQNSVNNSQNNSVSQDIHVENDNKIDTIEIIDVDDVIAENRSIIDKWKRNGSNISKLKVVVDVPNTACNNTTQPTPRAATPEVPVSKTVPIPVRLNHNQDHRLVTPVGSTSTSSQAFYIERDSQPSTSRTALPNIHYNNNMSIREVVSRFFEDDNVKKLLQKQRNLPAPKKIRVTSMIKDIFSRFTTRAVPPPNSNIRPQPMTTLPRPTNVSTANARATPRLVTKANTLPRPTNVSTANASNTPILVPTPNTLPRPPNMPTGTARATPILVPTANTPPRLTGQPRPTQTVSHLRPNNTVRSSLPKRNPKNQVTPNNSSTSKVSSDHDRNIGECPICLDPLSTDSRMASTICGHVFCLKCIKAAINANGDKCPTCRREFGINTGYHSLYL